MKKNKLKTNLDSSSGKGWAGLINIVLVFLVLFTFLPGTVFSATSSSLKQQQAELERKKIEAEKKRQEAEKEEQRKKEEAARLQGELSKLEKDISVTEKAIDKTRGDLKSTQSSILDTQSKISDKEKELENTKKQLSQMMVSVYTSDNNQFLKTFISSDSISSVFEEMRQEDAFQDQFQAMVEKASNEKKELVEAKKKLDQELANLQSLKKQQEIQRQGLENQERAKERLLSDAKTEIDRLQKEEEEMNRIESDLQRRIEAVIAEQIKLNQSRGGYAFADGPGSGTPIKRAQVIGYVGGCRGCPGAGFSTGAHLHFELRNSQGVAISPAALIDSEVPIQEGLYVISQGFGRTSFSGNYASGIHTGIDMAAPVGTPIKAARDGVIIFRQYYGGYGNAVLIAHPDGNYTLYGHMISS